MHSALLAAAIIAAQVRLGPSQEPGARTPGLAELERQVLVDSNDAIVHYQLGMAYWSRKQWDRAESAFRTSILVAPSYADPHLALAMVPVRRGVGYWKERRRREGEEKVAETLREYAGHYRRAFLLNPLVDLKVLAKFENERSGFLMVARALNQPTEARAALTRFVAMAPSRFAKLKSEALQALAELP